MINFNPHTVGFLNDGTLQLTDLNSCREYHDAHTTTTTATDGTVSDLSENSSDTEQGADDEDLIRLGLTPSKPKAQVTTANAKSNSLASIAADGSNVPRYVAPEVILHNTFSSKADSYSWSFLLFELLTLSKPYASYKAGQHLMKVCVQGQRANLAAYRLPKDLQTLSCQNWRQTATKRWSMNIIIQAIPAPRRRALRKSPSRQHEGAATATEPEGCNNSPVASSA